MFASSDDELLLTAGSLSLLLSKSGELLFARSGEITVRLAIMGLATILALGLVKVSPAS